VNLHRPLASVNLHRLPAHAHVRPPAHAHVRPPTPRELRIEEEEAVEVRSQLNLPSMDGSAMELEAAERVVMRWDSSLACGGTDEPMLFDRFLRAVDDLHRGPPCRQRLACRRRPVPPCRRRPALARAAIARSRGQPAPPLVVFGGEERRRAGRYDTARGRVPPRAVIARPRPRDRGARIP
jgi:hypothetical protein